MTEYISKDKKREVIAAATKLGARFACRNVWFENGLYCRQMWKWVGPDGQNFGPTLAGTDYFGSKYDAALAVIKLSLVHG